jgi:hypothetical protein
VLLIDEFTVFVKTFLSLENHLTRENGETRLVGEDKRGKDYFGKEGN